MSKGLEALKIMLQWFDDEHVGLDEVVKESKEYQIIEKELKALEIIKKKDVWVYWLKKCKTLKEYNDEFYDDYHITEEEFNLLKEVLL